MSLVRYEFASEKPKKSETLDSLPQFKRVHQVNITDGFVSCFCKFRSRYGINYPHVYHVVSQFIKNSIIIISMSDGGILFITLHLCQK